VRLERELAVTPEAAAEARHALGDIADVLPGGRARDVRLLVSELVTNAVRHANLDAGDQILLVIELVDNQLRVEVRWLALGGAAGDADDDEADGLSRFKRGWATGTRQVYLCGKVLQPDAYRRLAGDAPADMEYFPAYRRDHMVRVEPVPSRQRSSSEQ